jgi:hypothetical protein
MRAPGLSDPAAIFRRNPAASEAAREAGSDVSGFDMGELY